MPRDTLHHRSAPAHERLLSRPHPFRILRFDPSHYDDDGTVIQWRRSTSRSAVMAKENV
jgi:hypothetical protein